MLSSVEGLRARVVDALRRVAGHRRLLPLTALVLRSRTVHPASSFALREAAGRRRVGIYRLRDNGLRVAIRHGTGDVVTLGEVFHEHDYEPASELQGRLRSAALIVDLGANIGLFGAYAAACWPEASILAFEPDPGNASIHERTIELNSLGQRWRLIRAAAGTTTGSARFLAGGAALSRFATGDEPSAIEVPVEDVMSILADADLVKMDIEGGEWAILTDARFRESPPRTIVLEYHPGGCPTDDPRKAVESVLEGAGLDVRPIWHRADGHGMLWAWQS